MEPLGSVPRVLNVLPREKIESTYYVILILFTSQTSISGFNSPNGEGYMPSPFSSGVPRDTIGKEIPLY